MLSKHGGSVSMIETLAPKLSEYYELKAVSDKKNIIIRFFFMIASIIKYKNKIEIILIDSYSSKAFWYTIANAFISRLLGIPYAPILRGGDFPNRLEKNPKLCSFVFYNSVINISPSRYLEYHFKQAGYQVSYIPNFIPIEKYHFIARKKLSPKILWVRAFHKIYNPSMAIQVLYNLLKYYPNAELCMVGTDSDGSRSIIESQIKELNIENHILITGVLSKDQWIELSKNYDIFINTTNFDNMPVTVIEGMALGLPIISTNAGGLPYLLHDEEDALLVDIGDVNQMLSKIVRLLSDEELAYKLSTQGRKSAEQYDWASVKMLWSEEIEKYKKFY